MEETRSQYPTTLSSIYASLLNRAPDAGGMQFWIHMREQGASWEAIIQSLLSVSAVKAIYPEGQSPSDFVSTLYKTLFDRTPDAAGLAYWVETLQKHPPMGLESRAWLTLQIIESASQSDEGRQYSGHNAGRSQAFTDNAIITNKSVAGVYFATVLGNEDVDLAHQMLAVITSDPRSIKKAITIVSETTPVAPSLISPTSLAPPLIINVEELKNIKLDSNSHLSNNFRLIGHELSSDQWLPVANDLGKVASSMSNGAYVDYLYNNVLSRGSDAARQSWWVSDLIEGSPRDNFLATYPQAELEHQADATYVHARISVASYAAQLNRDGGSVDLSGVMNGVTNANNALTKMEALAACMPKSAEIDTITLTGVNASHAVA